MSRREAVVTWLALLAGLLAVWSLAAATPGVSAHHLPPPSAVLDAAVELTVRGILPFHARESLRRIATAGIVALVVAVPVGLLLGASRRVGDLVGPVLRFFQAVPGIAWLPLALVWSGYGERAVAVAVSFAVIVPVLSGALPSAQGVSGSAILRTPGASIWSGVRDVVLPAILPGIATGMRRGLAHGWWVLIAAEMLVGVHGLGFMLSSALYLDRTARIVAGMVAIGALWVTLDHFVLRPLEEAALARGAATEPRTRPRLASSGEGAVALALLVAAWAAASAAGVLHSRLLASPGEVLRRAWEMARDGALWIGIGASAGRLLPGVAVGVSLAVGAAVAAALGRRPAAVLQPVAGFFAAIPGIAWLPLAITWTDPGWVSVALVVFITAFSSAFREALAGVRAAEPAVRGARVAIPGAVPGIAAGLRRSVGVAWHALIAAEMMVSGTGLGFLVFDAQNAGRSDAVLAGFVAIGLLGLLADRLLLRPLERWAAARPERVSAPPAGVGAVTVRAALRHRTVRFLLVLAAVWVGWQACVTLGAGGRIDPALAGALARGSAVDVAVTLDFTPEDFHVSLFQAHGAVSGVRGTTVLLDRVPAADVRRIARHYWVRRIAPR